jgi:CheY-like chemotaxis protein
MDRRVLSRPQRILIVDDSPDVRELWNLWLTFWGFNVQEACDGADALRKARSFEPHLVLMDLWMPIINGLRATEQLKADPLMANVPVLAVSAEANPAAPQWALAAGCEAFLLTPTNPDLLLNEVRAALRRVLHETSS